MNYEQLLDEIMVTTLSAKEFIGFPQKEFRYAVCPWTLEFHTMIFLASSLLAFDQQKPLIFLIQQDELPAPVLLYTGKIGPHFGRSWDLSSSPQELFIEHHIPQTQEKHYPYLDKLFSYLAVINTHQEHLVLFIKKGEKTGTLAPILKKLLQTEYSLMILSNCYEQASSQEGKEKSELLISHLLKQKMNLEEKKNFPAFSVLSDLLPQKEPAPALEQLINTGELGLDPESTTSLWFMMK